MSIKGHPSWEKEGRILLEYVGVVALRRPRYKSERDWCKSRQESSLLSLSKQLPSCLPSDLRFAPLTCEGAQTLGVRLSVLSLVPCFCTACFPNPEVLPHFNGVLFPGSEIKALGVPFRAWPQPTQGPLTSLFALSGHLRSSSVF